MHILNVAHSPTRYCILVFVYILLHLPMDRTFAQNQSISTAKDSSQTSKSISFPLTPETLSNYQVNIQTASNLPLAHSPFSSVFKRVDNSTLQPVSRGASKGRLKFSEQATAASSTELTNSTEEIQEFGEWELEYRESKSGSLPSASDTAIVGGSTRIGSQGGSGKAVDLKIKYRKKKKNADTTTTIELEWLLDVNDGGKASGTMTGYIESKREYASGSGLVTIIESTRIDSVGNMVMQFITTADQSYRSESTTTFDRNGDSTTIKKDNYNTETSKGNSNQEPIEFNRHWFDIKIGNAKDPQHSEKNEFPPDNLWEEISRELEMERKEQEEKEQLAEMEREKEKERLLKEKERLIKEKEAREAQRKEIEEIENFLDKAQEEWEKVIQEEKRRERDVQERENERAVIANELNKALELVEKYNENVIKPTKEIADGGKKLVDSLKVINEAINSQSPSRLPKAILDIGSIAADPGNIIDNWSEKHISKGLERVTELARPIQEMEADRWEFVERELANYNGRTKATHRFKQQVIGDGYSERVERHLNKVERQYGAKIASEVKQSLLNESVDMLRGLKRLDALILKASSGF